MSRHESVAELEQQVVAKRRALTASLAQARLQLQPTALANEAGDRFRTVATDALHRAAEKARTPTGIWTAAAVVAISLLTIASRLRPANRAPKQIEPPTAGDDLAKLATVAPRRDDDRARTFATLTAALAAGALVARFVPPLAGEEEMLSGVGAELRLAFEEWARRQVTRLAHPQPQEPLRLANAIALSIGLLLTKAGSRSRQSDAKAHPVSPHD